MRHKAEKWYFLVCSAAGALLCLFLISMILFKAAHPVANARVIFALLLTLVVFVWATVEMLQEYRAD